MSEKIIRGTTPSFIVDFSEVLPLLSADYPEDVPSLSIITQVSLILIQRGIKKDLSEGLIYDNINNTISYHFTQEETFDMQPTRKGCECKNKVELQMDIYVSEEAYRVVDRAYEVEDSHRTKVFVAE